MENGALKSNFSNFWTMEFDGKRSLKEQFFKSLDYPIQTQLSPFLHYGIQPKHCFAFTWQGKFIKSELKTKASLNNSNQLSLSEWGLSQRQVPSEPNPSSAGFSWSYSCGRILSFESSGRPGKLHPGNDCGSDAMNGERICSRILSCNCPTGKYISLAPVFLSHLYFSRKSSYFQWAHREMEM